MANHTPGHFGDGSRPSHSRTRQVPQARRATPSSGARFKQSTQTQAHRPYTRSTYNNVRPVNQRLRRPRQRRSKAPFAIAGILVLVAILVSVFVIVPAVRGLLGGSGTDSVPAGQDVTLTIPEGSSGDEIAELLAKNHVIDDPKAYYAAVTKANAEMSLKPGDYLFQTGQDPDDVVALLVSGPNAGTTLTIQEGLTVPQTAERVSDTLGISPDAFLAQAKASNSVSDYPFLEGAYNDSLEGYLYPKTYSFSGEPSADDVIRKLLDQFEKETSSLNLSDGANGLTGQQLVTMASLIERETAVESERPLIASVIYNRLSADMPLQIDAAIVYARGGGSQAVTYSDLEIDSPYNVYKNYGLTPGPICSPSVSSITAACKPESTDYLYYVASSAGDGTHIFSSDYEQFEKDSQEYSESTKQ